MDARGVSKLREDYVRLLCERCHHTLDWYFKDGQGGTFTADLKRRELSKGPNGWRVTYNCNGRHDGRPCGARPSLLLDKLLPLVPVAHRGGASILTNYKIC